jgi:hypothetical protein
VEPEPACSPAGPSVQPLQSLRFKEKSVSKSGKNKQNKLTWHTIGDQGKNYTKIKSERRANHAAEFALD